MRALLVLDNLDSDRDPNQAAVPAPPLDFMVHDGGVFLQQALQLGAFRWINIKAPHIRRGADEFIG